MNKATSSIKWLSGISLMCFISCSHNLVKPPLAEKFLFGIYMPSPPQAKPDTNKQTTLTPTQRQALLDKYYKYNYDKYFSPEFIKLNAIIANQAKGMRKQDESIAALTDMLINMRVRSIKRTDSFNIVNARKDREYFDLEKNYSEVQKNQVARNAKQINNLNQLANILLAAGVIMIICIIAGYIAIRILYKKMNTLYINFANNA